MKNPASGEGSQSSGISITPFQERVYNLLKQIPLGRVTTYASLARALNTSPRAIGNALRNNRFAPQIPCHRCVASTGYVNGYDGEVIPRASLAPEGGTADGKAAQRRAKDRKKKRVLNKTRRAKSIPPSGINIEMKLKLLKDEGVRFDDKRMLIDRDQVMWDGPWKL